MNLRYRFPSKVRVKLDDDILNNERLKFINKIVQYLKNEYKLIFLDETTLNRNIK